jgi:hypothetical protein
MPKSTRRGGLHPYQYWILWVLNDEGGSAELITIYQQVKAKLSALWLGARSDKIPASTKDKLMRLTVAVALACAIFLSSIPASAKCLLMVQFGTDSELVWKWIPFDVYSGADECKHGILSYQLNVSLGNYLSRPLICLSDQDRRWGDQRPQWILRASSAPFNTFVAVFPD